MVRQRMLCAPGGRRPVVALALVLPPSVVGEGLAENVRVKLAAELFRIDWQPGSVTEPDH
ncbi:hypothetical protein RB628_34210 [Streptomyces sp. ADMS]|uniref:hypothetical protein n=1 Tax=Streptomyces sp. ADMS TaxID=3071415 RepID=UPI00296ED37C|nr:hypothetical protein [Streptomyces sp. ADMS]MDW4910250.1 hypothetical protein [Streptomyces sp. ADMS]